LFDVLRECQQGEADPKLRSAQTAPKPMDFALFTGAMPAANSGASSPVSVVDAAK